MNPLPQVSVAASSAGPPMTAVVIDDSAQLAALVPSWENLAAAALEPNVFYEPWMFLPALQAFGKGKDFRFLFLYTSDPARPRTPLLCGFFPLERRRGFHRLPVGILGLWTYSHCYLGTPLLRAGYARAALTAFFDWLAAAPGSCPLVQLNLIPAEGPFHQLLVDELNDREAHSHVAECWTRALLRPQDSTETYLRTALTGTLRRALKRKRKRLAEAGKLRCRALAPEDDVAGWLEDFLQLEAGGWKGTQETALACTQADRAFFTEVASQAFRRGRLALLDLQLDGRPIACRCSFLAGDGAFSFKTAYAEDFAAFSPGVLLEMENIHHAHALGLRWMDSCTSPDNAMINRLWQDRRALQTLVVATSQCLGGLVLSVVPLLRWLNQALRRPFRRKKRTRG